MSTTGQLSIIGLNLSIILFINLNAKNEHVIWIPHKIHIRYNDLPSYLVGIMVKIPEPISVDSRSMASEISIIARLLITLFLSKKKDNIKIPARRTMSIELLKSTLILNPKNATAR
ncbi:hypothetical protein [Ligilactobacillus ruminis]|uniref:hypothetical protein n=1 Tax=Ligilactobacillus ruminis TaxID=1623 RepID=UPI002079BE23|nr:hypothetical protein [Ligilactobacillus ruminis]